jgi:serine O-acetyltransferase
MGRLRFFIINTAHQFKLILHIPIFALYLVTDRKQVIDQDIDRWLTIRKLSERGVYALASLFLGCPGFRNVFYHRVQRGNFCGWMLLPFFNLLYPPLNSLYLYADKIEPGLYIQHGVATIVRAKSIGKDCRISQQVTIGCKNGHAPTIGDRVTIYCGAKIIGDVVVGDGCIIGAGAVVVKDCKPNGVYVGVPAKLVSGFNHLYPVDTSGINV